MALLKIKESDDEVIARALAILDSRLHKAEDTIKDSTSLKTFLTLKLALLEHESFGTVYLDSRNRVLKHETLFFGTLNHTAVYPREILKRSLSNNASGVILYHNHPGGTAKASPADIGLTKRLSDALEIVDIRLLDHFIIAGSECISLSETGQMR